MCRSSSLRSSRDSSSNTITHWYPLLTTSLIFLTANLMLDQPSLGGSLIFKTRSSWRSTETLSNAGARLTLKLIMSRKTNKLDLLLQMRQQQISH